MTVFKQRIRRIMRRIPFVYLIKICCLVLSGMGCVLQNISPFGVACATVIYADSPGSPMVLWIVLGILLGGFGAQAFKYLIAVLLLTVTTVKPELFSTHFRSRFLFAICLFLADLIYCGFAENSMYYWMVSVAEIVVGLFFLKAYEVVFARLKGDKLRKTASKKELESIFVVFCIGLSGLSQLPLPEGMQIVSVIAIFVIFFCAYCFSIHTCCVLGTVLGFMASISNPEMIYSVGAYSVAALVCSMCKRMGKFGIVTGFILTNALFVLYVNGSQTVLIHPAEICIAGSVFALIPARRLLKIKHDILLLLQRQEVHKKTEREAFEEMTVKKLNRIADAFSVMSASMKKDAKEKKKEANEAIGVMAEDVYARVCGACERKERCLAYRKDTRIEIALMLKKTVQRGWTELYDLTGDLKNYCLHNEKMVSECNKVYELFRVNRVWENRVSENRELVSNQLKEVSGVVRGLADEITETVEFEEESETKIIMLLDGLGISVENVIVTKGMNNRLEVEVALSDCRKKNLCERDVKTVLKKVTGKNFLVQKEKCTHETCLLKYREKENYEAEIGIARRRPSEEKACGDSYAILHPEDGKMVVALSDGMGRGSRAAKESKETVGLLEHLLMAGVQKDSAIKLINSVLVLKSYDENFATLDLLVLDLFTGEGELIKNASACSYICRGNQVGVIAAQALPAGILGEMETANRKLVFREGDLILIVSDGVTDVCVDDKWIKDFLLDLKNSTAQQGADRLMEEAVRRILICRDDMTVILIKISEK